MKDHNNSEILIYQSENGATKIDVTFKDETVWLSRQLEWKMKEVLSLQGILGCFERKNNMSLT